MFKYMFTGDWLYMLFMHQACVYKTKQQYLKSNEILTAVIKEAHLNYRINDILKDAIQAFQVKMNVKQEYLAYYVWKHTHNCYNAMTTSPVESINCHIKHRSKASTLNNTSQSLMLKIEGANSRIAGIESFRLNRVSTSRASGRLGQCLILLLNFTLHHFYDMNPYTVRDMIHFLIMVHATLTTILTQTINAQNHWNHYLNH